MPVTPPIRPGRRVRVVLSAAPLLSFVSVSKAAALAIAELGAAAFFVMGVTAAKLGPNAAVAVFGAVLLGAYLRSADIESWSFFVSGGVAGRAERAFGPRVAAASAALVTIERLLFAALAA